VLHAILARLGAIRPRSIAVFTPYLEDLTSSVALCIAEAGYSVAKAVGMGLRDNLDIGRVIPAEIESFVESNVAATASDCVFLSCTNWRAVEALESLRSKLGIPVVTSNQAAMDTVQQAAAVEA
jgi:maleate isomerase